MRLYIKNIILIMFCIPFAMRSAHETEAPTPLVPSALLEVQGNLHRASAAAASVLANTPNRTDLRNIRLSSTDPLVPIINNPEDSGSSSSPFNASSATRMERSSNPFKSPTRVSALAMFPPIANEPPFTHTAKARQSIAEVTPYPTDIIQPNPSLSLRQNERRLSDTIRRCSSGHNDDMQKPSSDDNINFSLIIDRNTALKMMYGGVAACFAITALSQFHAHQERTPTRFITGLEPAAAGYILSGIPKMAMGILTLYGIKKVRDGTNALYKNDFDKREESIREDIANAFDVTDKRIANCENNIAKLAHGVSHTIDAVRDLTDATTKPETIKTIEIAQAETTEALTNAISHIKPQNPSDIRIPKTKSNCCCTIQ